MITEHAAALRILMNEDLYLILHDLVEEKMPAEQFVAAEPIITEETIKHPEFIFVGKNQKNFLILTNEALKENHLKALESTLSRKQLSLDDVAIVDYSAYNDIIFEDLNASFMPQKLVLFGLEPNILLLPETPLNEVSSQPDLQILYTYSFSEMLGNKEKTKAFWEPMKNL